MTKTCSNKIQSVPTIANLTTIADLNYYVSIAENSTHKKRVNCDKCNFATKQRIFGIWAIVEILCYRGLPIPKSRTLSHPIDFMNIASVISDISVM